MKGRNIVSLITIRIICGFAIQTYFDPDEYWQSIEIAHNYIFGYGYVTWEWDEQLRGFLHPAIFATLYSLLKCTGLDTPFLVKHSPRILQALFAVVGDLYLFKLVQNRYNRILAKWVLFIHLTNWFTLYCIGRTYSNSLETVLTIVALNYWYNRSDNIAKYRNIAVLVASLSFIIRPTTGILWLFLGIVELFELKGIRDRFIFVAHTGIIGSLVVAISLLIDKHYYGQWTFVIYNFLYFNVVEGASSIYGSHPFHWYFTQGLPTMLGPYIIPLLIGVYLMKDKNYIVIVGWFVSVFSLLPHKEFRFLLPILPLCNIYVAYVYYYIYHLSKKTNSIIKSLLVLFTAINILMACYFGLVHQRGVVDVVDYIQKHENIEDVHFLMPCHSTPYYAHVHRNISMWFLDCAPNLHMENYIDEADLFYIDPMRFLEEKYTTTDLPTHFVIFDVLHANISSFLQQYKYTIETSIFHSHILDGRKGNYVLVFSK
eukprot:TRINITY_DN12371_c0_g1_i1.p1 TRINITY_DN12371_c0_g1~~TRINITY_DN12371_c0_g1_i1.p1  ORF type:complete len:485 (+),score=40.51 TRINITY_DN12371_c0_g1_i1:1-1455(+)